jgi:hypothetical protein
MHWMPADPRRQHQIVTDLEGGLRSGDQEERATAHELLQQFAQHPARLADPAQRAQTSLAALGVHGPPAPPTRGQGWQGQPAGPSGPPTATGAGRSTGVTVLAWIGGGVVALVLLLVLLVSCLPDVQDPDLSGDQGLSGTQLATEISAQLDAAGIVHDQVTCGPLAAPAGSSTLCSVSANGVETSITVVSDGVQGGRVLWRVQ